MASEGYIHLHNIESLKSAHQFLTNSPVCLEKQLLRQELRQVIVYETNLFSLKPVEGGNFYDEVFFTMDFSPYFFLSFFLIFILLSFFEKNILSARGETKLIFLLTGLCTTGNYKRNCCIIDVVRKQEDNFHPKMSPLS